MARILEPEKRPNGLYYRISVEVNGQRKKISFGVVDKKIVEKLLAIIQELELLKIDGSPIPLELQTKLKKLSVDYLERLKKVGLIEIKDSSRLTKLSDLFDAYCASLSSKVLPQSLKNYRSTLRVFERYFSPDYSIQKITTGNLEDFVSHSRLTKEQSTIGNYVKRGCAAFKYAVKHQWIANNPFNDLSKKGLVIKKGEEKQKLINQRLTNEVIAKILSCPKVPSDRIQDLEWNALIALIRFTGCRISEALILRWCDVDFDNNTISIRGKRDGNNGGRKSIFRERTCLLSKELVPYLINLRNACSAGTTYVLNKIEGLEGAPDESEFGPAGNIIRRGRWGRNVRTTWRQILKRNGIQEWPQLFHALRQYRINELELAGVRPIAIRLWTGNSEATAQKYYSVATKEDLDRALAINWGENGAFNSAQTVSGCIAKENVTQEIVGPSQNEPYQAIPKSAETDLSGVFSSLDLQEICRSVVKLGRNRALSDAEIADAFMRALLQPATSHKSAPQLSGKAGR